ncbi:hypothetical protein QOZ80_1AG0011020 [Eleusine coracana subsp. coracana]|nr:hypothetical protein QOZ80_1AG0011020 [Eleusine coracana subsp. coracana]
MESKPAGDDLGSLAAASFPLLVYEYSHGEPPAYSHITLSRLWVLIENDTDSLQTCLWNPHSGEKIALPAMEKKELPKYCECLLSRAVSSPDCRVLIYDLSEPELLFCRVRGGTAWFSQSYDLGHLPPAKRTISGMAAVEGKFYFLHSRDVVGVLSLADEDPEPRFEMATFHAAMPGFVSESPQRVTVVTMTYLVESSGELFLVCLFFHDCTLEQVAGRSPPTGRTSPRESGAG